MAAKRSDSPLKTVKNGSELKPALKINGKWIPTPGGTILNKLVAAGTGNPYARDAWNEGNWNQDRPLEYIPWDKPEEIIKMCYNAYFWSGMIGNVIDIMTDFSVEGIKIQHPDKSSQAFLNNWWRIVKGNKALHDIFLELFRAGNAAIQKKTAPLDKAGQSKITKATAADLSEFPVSENTLKTREIPYQYITYDPRSLRVYGDETVGDVEYYIILDKNAVDALYGYDRTKVKKAVTNSVYKLNPKTLSYEYLLPRDKFTHLAWRKPSYSKYGFPFTTRVLDECMVRRKFLVMMKAGVDGWLNAVRIWKLGHIVGDQVIVPNEDQFAKLASLLKSHQPGAIIDLLWNLGIELEEHYPPVEKVFSNVPFESIRKEIKDGLGVPDVLIDGGSGNFANAYLAIKTLVERLEYAREVVETEWLMPELIQVCESLGFRNLPRIKWGHMNLRDESTMLKMLTALRDRKLLSKESLLESFDENWTIEKARLEQEEDETSGNKKAFKNYGPYYLNDQDLVTAANKQMGGGGGPGGDKSPRGKPSGKNAPITKRRDSGPKGLKTKGNETVDDFGEPTDIEASNLMYTEGPAALDSCQKQVYQSLVKKYKKKTGKSPSDKKRKELESSSWAICRSRLNMSETSGSECINSIEISTKD